MAQVYQRLRAQEDQDQATTTGQAYAESVSNGSVSPLPARRARVMANDAAILDAAVGVLARDGWGDLALAKVGREAGLSHRAVQLRYDRRSELAASVWHERVGRNFADALESLLDSAGLLGGPADPGAFDNNLNAFSAPSPELVAAADLLIVGQFEPLIATAINETLIPQLHEWLTPHGRAVPRALAAQRAMVFIHALGLLGMHPHARGADMDFSRNSADLLDALQHPAKPQTLPRAPAWHLKDTVEFDTGDAVQDEVLKAALVLISERGYDATRTLDIAKRAGVPEATLFTRFPTKLDVLTTATELEQAAVLRRNVAYLDRVAEEFGPGIGEAVSMRAFMRPAAARERLVGMEQYRLAWHVPALQQSQEAAMAQSLAGIRTRRLADNPDWNEVDAARSLHWDLALGMGWVFLATVVPDSWKLPYDVVTVPLMG